MRTALRAFPLAAVAVVFALTACAPTKAPPPAPTSPSLPFESADPIAKDLFSSTNADRAANALDPLAWNDQLGGLAQSWSEHLAATGQLVHQNLDALLQTPACEHPGQLQRRRPRCGLQRGRPLRHRGLRR
jgi:uncharacterized protein YkwD